MGIKQEKHPLLKRAPDLGKMVPYWDKTDAIIEGHDAMRRAGEEFLPKFGDEEQSDYKKRLTITKFTNIFRDVVEGLSSKPFQEEVTLIGSDVPEEIVNFIENVDGSGNNLTVFAAQTFYNAIASAIDWIFVDYPSVDVTRSMTRAEAKARNIKPFWSHILGRNVLEIRTEVFGSDEVIVYFRVLEPEIDGKDKVRVFTKLPDAVVWELYEENPEAKKLEDKMVKIDEGQLSIDVIPMVPFITGRREGKKFNIQPIMQDAADLQVTLYQEESGLQFIKTMAGYPMLAANGIRPERDKDGQPKKLPIGPMKVLYGAPDGSGNHGTWSYVEPNANSMEFLKKSIDSTKQDLRELGRQPLTALSSQLTTVTTSIAAGKAKTAVGAWALMLKDALENALMLTAKYMNLEYETEVNVYTDFDNVSDTNADIDNLLTAREKGDISRETLHFEMKRRKILSPEFSTEEENKRLLAEIPSDGLDAPENEEDIDNEDDV